MDCSGLAAGRLLGFSSGWQGACLVLVALVLGVGYPVLIFHLGGYSPLVRGLLFNQSSEGGIIL